LPNHEYVSTDLPGVISISITISNTTQFTPLSYGQRRFEHAVPELPPLAKDFPVHGIPDFMTPRTVRMNWDTYMNHLCDELNQATISTPDYHFSAIKLAEKYSHSSQHASLFNNASMAVNNHWFFRSISPVKMEPSPKFLADIKTNFDSLDNLRLDFLETADAMFGNGFVWLMKEHSSGNLRILCTYNAGSPYPNAHHRRQSREMATQDIASRLSRPQNHVGSFGASSRNPELGPTNALKAEPILCLNMWQQAWLPDYGLMGKRNYILCWWERINWELVEQAAADVGMRFGASYGGGRLGSVVGGSLNDARW
jgi:Fe-Mn family superoxide dismutase